MRSFYKRNKKLCVSTIIGMIITCLLGALFHFVYEWSGANFIIGLFVPVNESIWEHMKLAFFPMLIFFVLEYPLFFHHYPHLFYADLPSLLMGTLSMPVIFYTYTGILGFHTLLLDILTLIISVTLGFAVRLRLIQSGYKKYIFLYFICTLIFGVCFLIFTYYPPSLALFIPGT